MWAEFTIVGVAFLVVVSAVCGIFALMAYGVELVVSQFVTWWKPRGEPMPSCEEVSAPPADDSAGPSVASSVSVSSSSLSW